MFTFVLGVNKTCHVQICSESHVKTLKDFFAFHRKTFQRFKNVDTAVGLFLALVT